jgi:hypothetical protein
MGPLLAALLTIAVVVVAARRVRRLPSLEVLGLSTLFFSGVVAVFDDGVDDGGAAVAFSEPAFAGVVVGGIVVVLFLALPLLALLLLLEHHLHVKRVLAGIAADNEKLKTTMDNLAAELASLRAQPSSPPPTPRDDDGEGGDDDDEDRRRRRRDEEAD